MTTFDFSKLVTSIFDPFRGTEGRSAEHRSRAFTEEELDELLKAESRYITSHTEAPQSPLTQEKISECLPDSADGSNGVILDTRSPLSQHEESTSPLPRNASSEVLDFTPKELEPRSQFTAHFEIANRSHLEGEVKQRGKNACLFSTSPQTELCHTAPTELSVGPPSKYLRLGHFEMAHPFPYTYISCPCTETSRPLFPGKRMSGSPQNDQHEDEGTFDPRAPRSNFSLFPPEHLLYCEDCRQIKCPRCIIEEIVCWYCPNCLFETPTSSVRSDGNRCARNCFNCPICTSPLTVNTLETGEGGPQQGPWILACGYCTWTTLDIGIQFDKPTNIRARLDKLHNGGQPKPAKPVNDSSRQSSVSKDPQYPQDGPPSTGGVQEAIQRDMDHETHFAALKAFYKNQIAETSPSPNDPLLLPTSDYAYSSPSNLNRIMTLYTGLGIYGRKPKSKPPVMREAVSPSEGLVLPPQDVSESIEKMQITGWEGLSTMEQQRAQSGGDRTRFVDDLRPQPVLLRTKRSKRCKACKHILVKPEFKPQSTRFRINLIAFSHVPLITLRPLVPAGSQASRGSLENLEPLKATQFLLTLKNHIFDPVKISLATPAKTPGRWGTLVTVLCPVFEIGANSDVWDDALNPGNKSAAHPNEGIAEAGKVWEKGRNWSTVVLEVVPSLIDKAYEEDEDVLEIPVFVRQEWKETAADDSRNRQDASKEGEDDNRRELAYWLVLGIGRIKVAEGLNA